MQFTSRLDKILNIFQEQIERDGTLRTAEPLISTSASGLSGGLSMLSVLIGKETFAILGLTSPENAIQAPGLVQVTARRARARKVRYLILSNQHETIIQTTPRRDDEQGDVLRRYTPVQMLSNSPEVLAPPERLSLTNLAEKLATDLIALHRDGQLDMIEPDADYFVDRLSNTQTSRQERVDNPVWRIPSICRGSSYMGDKTGNSCGCPFARFRGSRGASGDLSPFR
jgi:hypothetical protein